MQQVRKTAFNISNALVYFAGKAVYFALNDLH